MSKRKVIPLHVERPTGTTPLTAAELAWATELNRVLQACPSDRIGAATMGDANLTLFDRPASLLPDSQAAFDRSHSDFIPTATRLGIVLAHVHSAFNIDSAAA